MEKLIVRNFGPIKEAEIDLTKYVVFIGDTSTGKSVLGKLISIFRDSFIKFNFDSNDFNFKNQLMHYNIDFEYNNSEFEYKFQQTIITLKDGDLSINQKVVTDEIKETITDVIKDFLLKNPLIKIEDGVEAFLQSALNLITASKFPTYIPAERILNSLIGNSISGLWANNVALPNCFKDFASKYEVARKQIGNASYEKFGFTYNFDNGIEEIIFQDVKLMLSNTSTGVQSLIPMLLVLDYELNSKENNKEGLTKTILIEELELSLFPKKQKTLVEHIISRFQDRNYDLILTTHSPYILTVLDTLMLAKNTFNEHPDLKEEINAIVPESNWIDYNDISVYEVRNDGKVYSIKNEEFKSIDTNAIDGVSDIISEEFDKLTELRYAH